MIENGCIEMAKPLDSLLTSMWLPYCPRCGRHLDLSLVSAHFDNGMSRRFISRHPGTDLEELGWEHKEMGCPPAANQTFCDPLLMGDAYTFTLLEKGRISPLLQSSMFVYCLEMRWTLLCHGPGPSMEKKEIGQRERESFR